MHLLVHFRRRDWSVNNLAVPPHTIKQGLYFNMPHAHGAALAWELLLNSMGRGTIQSSFSLMKKLHQEPQQSGVIYNASDYGGDFKSQFTPRLTVLMDQIIWGSQWKTGGAGGEGRGAQWQVTEDKTYKCRLRHAGGRKKKIKIEIKAWKAETHCSAVAARWTWSLLTHGEAPTLRYSTNERWQSPFDLTSSRRLLWETPKSICIIKSRSICKRPTWRFSDSMLCKLHCRSVVIYGQRY